LTIKGIIFDFDGVILDTEVPEYQSWQELYAEFDQYLTIEKWATYIGAGVNAFDPFEYLEELLGKKLNEKELKTRRFDRSQELLEKQELIPNVLDFIEKARKLGLKLAVASSSDRPWVEGHLRKYGIFDRFDFVHTCEDVENVKPDPALFLTALKSLGINKAEAMIVEDSPNGILAAKRAGIFCVCIPNQITSQMDTSLADIQLGSLAELTLESLLMEDFSIPLINP